MADQTAPPAAPEQAPLHQAAGPDAAKLHDHALQAEKHLEALATGLSQNHADPGAVKAVTSMADVMRKLLSTMAGQAQAEQPPEPRDTMGSATDHLVAQVRARHAQGQ